MAHKRHKANYRKNHGVPGVVYILENPGLRDGFYKIGCSRNSGSKRANDLNNDANTGTPGIFRCIFEYRTINCGKAEERVFEILSNYRQGKWGQEFFHVDLAVAKETITNVCKETDEEIHRNPPPVKPAPPVITVSIPNAPSITQPVSQQTITKSSKTDRFINRPVVNAIWLIIFVATILKWSSHHRKGVIEPPSQPSFAYDAHPTPSQYGFVPLEQSTPSPQSEPQTSEDVTSTNTVSGRLRHQFVDGEEVDYQLQEATTKEIQGSTSEPAPATAIEPKVQMTKIEIENLKICLDGRYKSLCKHNILSPEQATQVADANRLANLKSCLDGRYSSLCDHDSLSVSESADVDRAEMRANFKLCIDGRYPNLCNHARLSKLESVAVKEAEVRENLKICMDRRYPSLCDHSLLTSEELVKVRINEGGH